MKKTMDTVTPDQMMNTVIQDMLPWIEENLFDESLKVRIVTERSGYGHWHFQRVFHEKMGITAATYIRIRRIARAAFSLAFTEKAIIDIVVENGYSSQQNFNRTFKSFFTISPSVFRKTCCGRESVFKALTKDIYLKYSWIFFDNMFPVEIKNRCPGRAGFSHKERINPEVSFCDL